MELCSPTSFYLNTERIAQVKANQTNRQTNKQTDKQIRERLRTGNCCLDSSIEFCDRTLLWRMPSPTVIMPEEYKRLLLWQLLLQIKTNVSFQNQTIAVWTRFVQTQKARMSVAAVMDTKEMECFAKVIINNLLLVFHGLLFNYTGLNTTKKWWPSKNI